MQKVPTLTIEDFSSDIMIAENDLKGSNDILVTVLRHSNDGNECILEERRVDSTANKPEYSGEMVNGKMHGEGMLTGVAGTYVGEFQNGQAHGKGIYYFTYGAKYEGEWRNNVRHGFGTLTLPGGYPRYQGEWRNDEVCGKGRMLRSDGGIVEGIFDGSFNGIGNITYTDGKVYKGQFRHGERHGMGVLTTKDGEKFVGEFHGITPWEGIMTDIEGKQYKLEDGIPVAELMGEVEEKIALSA